MEANEAIEAYITAQAFENFTLKKFEEALEEVQDEAVKNALILLAKLSRARAAKSHLWTEVVGSQHDLMFIQHDLMLEPILERLAEDKEQLDKMK